MDKEFNEFVENRIKESSKLIDVEINKKLSMLSDSITVSITPFLILISDFYKIDKLEAERLLI